MMTVALGRKHKQNCYMINYGYYGPMDPGSTCGFHMLDRSIVNYRKNHIKNLFSVGAVDCVVPVV